MSVSLSSSTVPRLCRNRSCMSLCGSMGYVKVNVLIIVRLLSSTLIRGGISPLASFLSFTSKCNGFDIEFSGKEYTVKF
jgi:hypothetical protein